MSVDRVHTGVRVFEPQDLFRTVPAVHPNPGHDQAPVLNHLLKDKPRGWICINKDRK
jgi:hypothetical protein